MTPEEELRRAGKASEVLNNEAFKDAVSEIEQALLVGIQRTAFKDAELREKLCQRYALLHDLVNQLKTYMETGELAKASIAERIKAAAGF